MELKLLAAAAAAAAAAFVLYKKTVTNKRLRVVRNLSSPAHSLLLLGTASHLSFPKS